MVSFSWTREDDAPVNLGIKMMGGVVYKRYRVYTSRSWPEAAPRAPRPRPGRTSPGAHPAVGALSDRGHRLVTRPTHGWGTRRSPSMTILRPARARRSPRPRARAWPTSQGRLRVVHARRPRRWFHDRPRDAEHAPAHRRRRGPRRLPGRSTRGGCVRLRLPPRRDRVQRRGRGRPRAGVHGARKLYLDPTFGDLKLASLSPSSSTPRAFRRTGRCSRTRRSTASRRRCWSRTWPTAPCTSAT